MSLKGNYGNYTYQHWESEAEGEEFDEKVREYNTYTNDRSNFIDPSVTDFISAYKEQCSYKKMIILYKDLPLVPSISTIDDDIFSKYIYDYSYLNRDGDIFLENWEEKADLIVVDINYTQVPEIDFFNAKLGNSTYYVTENFLLILESLTILQEGGSILLNNYSTYSERTQETATLEKILNNHDFSTKAYFQNPDFSIISRGLTEEVFIANPGSDVVSTLDRFINKESTRLLESGLWVPKEEFRSFSAYEAKKELEILESQYKGYSQTTLGELISNAGINVRDYSKIETNEVHGEYLQLYFNSPFGLKQIEAQKVSKNLSDEDFKKVIVMLPPLKEQKKIIYANGELALAKKEINKLQKQLTTNPRNVESVMDVTEKALKAFNKLSLEDTVLEMARKGESKTVEFKQTFTRDVQRGITEREKSIQTTSLKNIVAFLNSEGGILLIGVGDDGEITGIEADYYENDDKYLLNFKNHIQNKIGEEFYPFIDWEIVSVLGKKVLLVSCTASPRPVYLNKKDFYVRTNPAVDKLEGPKLVDYINEHFAK